jgi:hypothetical protein
MTYVILGASLQDAQGAAMSHRERDRGRDVRLVTVQNALRDTQGRRVSGWEATEAAQRHPDYERASQALYASEMKGAK